MVIVGIIVAKTVFSPMACFNFVQSNGRRGLILTEVYLVLYCMISKFQGHYGKNFRFHLKSGFKIILALNYYILFDIFNNTCI